MSSLSGGVTAGAGVFKYARYPQYGGEMLIWAGAPWTSFLP